ncbi:guanine nucleotide-binding protein alpha-1 subunit [Anaeramoeba flamelloides]|uniref:Guanine nucleotide-binding protein alpha-1 subunit n=1 Tax=Anaeramoeba flamelloides TaxID=1746091 RepID=A0ABQ8Z429_9EUKA|nr:guanine nucleotide-binding protein alpha-1 subunit [Anaeramoeba flamelloides]
MVLLDNEIKILLLGPGDSGKSTVVKQMRLINGLDFDKEEREDFVDKIRFNVVQNTRALVFAMSQFDVGYSNKINLYLINNQILTNDVNVTLGDRYHHASVQNTR